MAFLRRSYACRECVELVTEYDEDVLGRRQRRRVDRHLGACVECTDYVEQLRITVRSLRALPPEPADAEVRERLLVLFRDARA